MPAPTLEEIAAARGRIEGRVHRTPMQHSTRLGERIGADLWLKCENLQKTGSFKARGALHRLLRLTPEERGRGVVTVSAGNHAQALAWAAREVGIECTVVMPANASATKAAASRGYGATVVLHGNVHEAFEKAYDIEREEGRRFVHAFDDPEIVAGAASAGVEIVEQVPDLTVVVAPIGGGGHIGGVASAVKQMRPEVRIYGVEPRGAAAMHASLGAGHAVRLDAVDTIADGLAPPMAGALNYEIVAQMVEEVVLVDDDEIVSALRDILVTTKLLVEPSGAAAVAALLAGRIPINPSDRVVAVLSGGNVGIADLAAYFG